MADLKISALTASTTPLAGTEVLPIVQSSTTKQVSIANVTAGRAVSTLSATSLGPNGIPITLQEITAAPSSATAAYVGVSTSAFLGGANGDLILIPRTSGANDVRVFVGSGTPTEALVVQGSSKDIRAGTGNFVPATAAKGVNFTANTPQAGMTSQLLNWYEEGTFTPTLSGATTTTYTTQTGRYTRVGRLVTFQCELQINSLGNGSTTTFLLGTLPNAGHFSTISVGFFSSVATAVSSLTGYINNGANSVTMQSTTVAGTSSASNAIFGNSARIIVSGQYSV